MIIETTEQDSLYRKLEDKSTIQILTDINQEDQSVADAVKSEIYNIETLVDHAVERMKVGGRLFYIGAGTSGRLGVLDASECPPTFGVSSDLVVGIIAGGDGAIRKAVENAEDNIDQAWLDLKNQGISKDDVLIGIAASGKTPYVIGGLKKANENGILTGCIVCNKKSPIAAVAAYPVEVVVGPEYLTGSTRMKAGTAQKLVLNMITTALMIKLGRVRGNKMVDMQLTNNKLVQRGIHMVMSEAGVTEELASKLLAENGSVRGAVEAYLVSL